MLPKSGEASTGARLLVTAAAFVVVVAGMKAAAPLMVPFLLSMFIAIICAPALYWLQARRVPTAVALLIVIASMGIIALSVVALVGSSLNSFAQNLPKYESSLRKTVDGALQLLDRYRVLDGLEKLSGEDPVESIRNSLDVGVAMRFAGETVGALSGAFGYAFLIVLTVIFILLEASGFPSKLRALSGGSDDAKQHFDRIVTDVRRYVALKTFMCLATGVSITIFLLLMGVDYPLMWGTLAFLLNYVPNIGSFIAAAPAVVLALVQFGWIGAGWTAAGYTVINVIIGNVVEPRILGKGLGLSTLVVFVSLVLWGWVLGPVGMLLSAPLTMVVKIALESQPDTRWIAVLLSADANLAEPPKGKKPRAP